MPLSKALEGIERPIWLIAGGRDKGGDFSRLTGDGPTSRQACRFDWGSRTVVEGGLGWRDDHK